MNTAILLSGGMDSIALAYWKRPELAITIDYGQASAAGEIRASQQICQELGIVHDVISVDCHKLGSGDLAQSSPLSIAPVPEWWPFRNQLLITLASMRAVTLGIKDLLFGAVQTDGCHVDGQKHFFDNIDRLVNSQEGEVRICAPAISMTTAELVVKSGIDMILLSWAHSCHVAEYACGRCRGCNKHRQVMMELGHEPY